MIATDPPTPVPTPVPGNEIGLPPAKRKVVSTYPFVLGLGKLVRRLPATIPTFLFLAIAWAEFGAGLNIPTMFWEPRSDWTLIASGIAITLLFAYVWTVTYVLDATFDRDSIEWTMNNRPHRLAGLAMAFMLPDDKSVEHTHGTSLRWYLSVTFLPCILLMFGATIFEARSDLPLLHLNFLEDGSSVFAKRCPLAVGIAIGALLLRILTRLAQRCNKKWMRVTKYIPSLQRINTSQDRWVRGMVEGIFVFNTLLYVLSTVSVIRGWYMLPSIVAACMLFAFIAGILGFVWYHFRRVALVSFFVLLILAIWSGSKPYKLELPGLEEEYRAARIGSKSAVQLSDFEPPKDIGKMTKDDDKSAEFIRVINLVVSYLDMLDYSPNKRKELTEKLEKLTSLKDIAKKYGELRKLYAEALEAIIKQEEAALNNWKKYATEVAWEKRKKTGAVDKNFKPKMVVFTVTGGANRSAVWTAVVMHELSKLDNRDGKNNLPGFGAQTRLISGASGGMVGATYHVGSLVPQSIDSEEQLQLQPNYNPADVGQDYLRPILNSVAFIEAPRLLLPFSYRNDRGEMLDRGLEGQFAIADPETLKRLNTSFSRTFQSIKDDEEKGIRPSLVFTPMQIEDGRRLIISNRRLPYMTFSLGNFLQEPHSTDQSDGTSRAKQIRDEGNILQDATSKNIDSGNNKRSESTDIYSRSAVEFFHLFPQSRDRFRLSTAARLNATFPFVSPAVELPIYPNRQIVDAGYYDNYGVHMTAAWLEFRKTWIAENTSGVVVVQIRDSASQYTRRHLQTSAESKREADQKSDPFSWLTSPLTAVDKARQTSASFRNDIQLQLLDAWFKEHNKDKNSEFFETVVFERETKVGMSWYLSKADVKNIKDCWPGTGGSDSENQAANRSSLNALIQWWNK